MKTGTCYFPTYGAAMRYYRPYLDNYVRGPHARKNQRTQALRHWIDSKLNLGEIHIGKPPLKPGDVLTIKDNRYHVTEGGK